MVREDPRQAPPTDGMVIGNDTQASKVDLPPDGTLIRVSQWRRRMAWIPTVLYALFALWSPVYAIQEGVPAAMLIGVLGFGFAAAVSARMALGGVILEPNGVKARNIWRTYHWRWDEIERFELRQRGEVPRFRIHLRDGKVRGFLGFFARSPAQEARGQAFFKALQERLRAEHEKPGSPVH